MTTSRAAWFQQARHLEGPERQCLRADCRKKFRNGPGEDFRCCREHRRQSEGLGGNSQGGSGRVTSRRVPA